MLGYMNVQVLLLKIDIRDIGFDEAKDKFLSMCEKQMDDLMRAWSMFEDTVGKTGNYDLAEKFSGKRFGSLMDNGLGMAGNASKSGNLWNMIISKTWSNANKLGSYGGDLPGDLFDRSEIFGLDKKSLEEKVRETFDKILLASPRFRKFQSEKNEGEMRKMREDLYSQVPGFVKMLEQWQKALQDDEDAAKKLRASGLDQVIRQEAYSGKPLLGICLGMQLLLDKSFEFGEHAGLGLIPGEVRPISEVIPPDYKIPHIGWNALNVVRNHPIFRDIKPGDCVYFVHSYYGAKCPEVIATAEYGADLTAAVGRGNVVGCQFHPEKSGDVGLGILKAFCEWDGLDPLS